MLDIIFISYDEPCADKNYAALKARFPHAKRVHGVKGIAEAHFAAAKKVLTKFFFVVDGDAEILDSFDFEFKPAIGEEEYVHIWNAYNPAIDMSYGYGGIKLFKKSFFKNLKTHLDFSTTLVSDVKYHEEISCITRFNSDAIRAYRGAYRESLKLYTTIFDDSKINYALEAAHRLEAWQHPIGGCDFYEEIVRGSRDGVAKAQGYRFCDELVFINDFDLIGEK